MRERLYTDEQNLCSVQTIPTLQDYIWLVAQARCGALPLSFAILRFDSEKEQITEAVEQIAPNLSRCLSRSLPSWCSPRKAR